MKSKSTPNKANKYDQDLYFKQQEHRDKEKRRLTASLYNKNRPLPKTRRGQRGK